MRAACLGHLNENHIVSSDAFAPDEKALLLKLLQSLKPQRKFLCRICSHTRTSAAAVHGHDDVCARCMLATIEAAVSVGAHVLCPICSYAFSMADLRILGASERDIRIARARLRSRAFATLTAAARAGLAVLSVEEQQTLHMLRSSIGETDFVNLGQDDCADEASAAYARLTSTPCPACGTLCQRVNGCATVMCQCGRRLQIRNATP